MTYRRPFWRYLRSVLTETPNILATSSAFKSCGINIFVCIDTAFPFLWRPSLAPALQGPEKGVRFAMMRCRGLRSQSTRPRLVGHAPGAAAVVARHLSALIAGRTVRAVAVQGGIWHQSIPSASLYISSTASSSAMSSLSRLRRAITLRITLTS